MIWFLTNDLMFSSRVEGVARRLERQLVVVPTVEALREKMNEAEGRPEIVLIDLTIWTRQAAGVIAALKSWHAPPQVIAYGPHVQEAQLAAAHQAGCDIVLTRGQFDKQMEQVLGS
jgi:DNA-binding NarL/FixJ family response regulator